MVVILIALGVHSCQVSAANSALKDYTNSVSSLDPAVRSDRQELFGALQRRPLSNATDAAEPDQQRAERGPQLS